jgi:hypothetical protein
MTIPLPQFSQKSASLIYSNVHEFVESQQMLLTHLCSHTWWRLFVVVNQEHEFQTQIFWFQL